MSTLQCVIDTKEIAVEEEVKEAEVGIVKKASGQILRDASSKNNGLWW